MLSEKNSAILCKVQWLNAWRPSNHYSDIIMGTMASQITSRTIVCSTVHSGTDKRKHQSSASLAFVRGTHWWPMNSPHKGPVTQKMFPFDDIIVAFMRQLTGSCLVQVMACHLWGTKPLPEYWLITNWNLWNKLNWNLDQNIKIFIQENAMKYVIHIMSVILPRPQRVNSSPPSAANMRQWISSAFFLIMACRLFGAKPLSKPMLGYSQLDP